MARMRCHGRSEHVGADPFVVLVRQQRRTGDQTREDRGEGTDVKSTKPVKMTTASSN
jgi:hypothetical protein